MKLLQAYDCPATGSVIPVHNRSYLGVSGLAALRVVREPVPYIHQHYRRVSRPLVSKSDNASSIRTATMPARRKYACSASASAGRWLSKDLRTPLRNRQTSAKHLAGENFTR
jgi:hypothetical protein